MRPHLFVGVSAFLSLQLCVGAAATRSWYIQPDGSGDAPTIQAGIDSAQAGDEVVLGPGTYTWTSQGLPYDVLPVAILKPGTTLRGELGPSSTIVDGERHGVFIGGDVGAVRIEGLTIRGASPFLGSYGGGINLWGNSHLAIRRCVLISNGSRVRGGAISCPTAVIEECEFLQNGAGEGAAGGAVSCDSALVENCVFKGNRTSGDGGSCGGALALGRGTVRNCLFEGNVAGDFVDAYGGAICAGPVTIDSCVFVDNEASCHVGLCSGGALYLAGSGSVITRSVFVRNRAWHAGAIYSRDPAQIEQCTLLANSAWGIGKTGGIVMNGGGSVRQVILAYTTEGRACSGAPGTTWTCSNLYANASGNDVCGVDAGGNLSVDPQFCAVDPAATLSVGLQQDSPCATGNHPDGMPCGPIGAGPVTCDAVLVHPRTWTTVKQLYRD